MAESGFRGTADIGRQGILVWIKRYWIEKICLESHFKRPRLVKEKMDRPETEPKTGRGFYDYENADTRTLFNEKYMGFIELLRLYERSNNLNFSGGIDSDGPLEIDAEPTKGKEMP